jgi:hypothetical protein
MSIDNITVGDGGAPGTAKRGVRARGKESDAVTSQAGSGRREIAGRIHPVTSARLLDE